jgi:hypothetical protein
MTFKGQSGGLRPTQREGIWEPIIHEYIYTIQVKVRIRVYVYIYIYINKYTIYHDVQGAIRL